MKIYLNDGNPIPGNENCYIIGKDGIYLQKDTGLIRATVKVSGVSTLKPILPKAELKIPQIPAIHIVKSLLFFKRIYRKHHSEAITLLYYNDETKDFYVIAPVQKVSSCRVDYETVAEYRQKGYKLIGTIHSHCDFDAFHSSVDCHDEQYFDGVHITLGNVNTAYCSVTASVVVNNNRFTLDPDNIILGIKSVVLPFNKARTTTNRFLDIERLMSYKIDLTENVSITGFNNTDYKKESVDEKKSLRWDFILPDNMDYRSIYIPDFWFNNVVKLLDKPFFADYLNVSAYEKTITTEVGEK